MRSYTTPKGNPQDFTYSSRNDPKYGPRQQPQKSKLFEDQRQKVVQDQHYSNNIMMTVLSTLESLQSSSKNAKVTPASKVYGYYDKVNYENKSYQELKSQLQTQLMLLKASRQVFQSENPKVRYELPKSFDNERVRSEINRFKGVFKGDEQILGMCRDFQRINEGQFSSNMTFETKNYAVKYSEQETAKNRRDIVSRGIFATNQMHSQKQRVDKMGVKNQADLPVYLNNAAYQYRNTKPSRFW